MLQNCKLIFNAEKLVTLTIKSVVTHFSNHCLKQSFPLYEFKSILCSVFNHSVTNTARAKTLKWD